MIRQTFSVLLLAVLVVVAAPGAFAQSGESFSLPVSLQATDSATHSLTPADPAASGDLVIGDTPYADIVFTSSSRSLEITLTSPTGEDFVFGAADTATVQTGFYPPTPDPEAEGAFYSYRLQEPVAGTWTYRVVEPDGLTRERGLLVSLSTGGSVRTGLVVPQSDRLVGAPVPLGLLTVDGETVLRAGSIASVVAAVYEAATPGVVLATPSFRDDGQGADATAGDGLYSATYIPSGAGEYAVAVTVEGTGADGSTFRRRTVAAFRALPELARLGRDFTDAGTDTDGDGLFDRLDVAPSLEVLVPGRYSLQVTLRGSNGVELVENTLLDLPVGPTRETVSFPADDLRQIVGVSGPYAVRRVLLEKLDEEPVATADLVFDLGDTAAYDLGAFLDDPLAFAAAGTSRGVDTDGNGLFDLLSAEPLVGVTLSGFYRWSARLVDSNGTQIDLAAGAGFLSPGIQPLGLTFDGRAIGANGVDGPYRVRNLIVFGAGESLIVDEAHRTRAFSAEEFEGFVFDQTPPELTVTVHPEVLWPPNHQMVEIAYTVEAEDNVDPDPIVELVSVTSNEGDDALGDGRTTEDIQVDGSRVLLRAERSGLGSDRVYTLTFSATDGAGNTAFESVEVRVPHDRRGAKGR